MLHELHLNDIKSQLLLKYNINFVTPRDCETIAMHVKTYTRKDISITTIKRIFGLASQDFNFSRFTLSTLTEFLKIQFTIPNVIIKRIGEIEDWQLIKSKADEISKRTIDHVSEACSVPYEITIRRKFAEDDFNYFYKSKYVFTSIVASPGLGKSLLLSHLAANFYKADKVICKNSTLLFSTANDFFDGDEFNFDLEYRLKQLLNLDIEGNMLEYLDTNHQLQGGKFILILDEFNDLFLERWNMEQLFTTLKNLFFSLKYFKNIKLVISMRTSVWAKFYQSFSRSSFLKSIWFPGTHYNVEDHSNMPLLCAEEVEQLMFKLNSNKDDKTNTQLNGDVRFPDFLRLYALFEDKSKEIDSHLDAISMELASMFMHKEEV